jgi:hypothetical protein
MATLAPAAKMRRVLEFLIGVRDDRVRAALGTHGFTERDRVQGWELLSALGMTQSAAPPVTTASPALDALDEWRGHWLRVARASLTRDYPQVLATVFAGLDKPNQPSLSVVTVFVQHFEKLERAKDAASRGAIAKLQKRGLTDERVQEAKRLVDNALHPARVEMPDPELRRMAIHKTESELWDYYVEWGQIARAVIKDERLLALLGYRSGNTDDESTRESAEPLADEARIARKQRRR